MGAKVYSLAMDPGENPVSFAVLFAHFLSKKKKYKRRMNRDVETQITATFFLKHLQCVR